eukprot:1105034-Pyramimonas_sp.AAC.1
MFAAARYPGPLFTVHMTSVIKVYLDRRDAGGHHSHDLAYVTSLSSAGRRRADDLSSDNPI